MDEVPDSETPQAVGHLVVFLANLLSRTQIMPVEEFAALLDVYAATVGETDPRDGAVLVTWGAAVRASIGNGNEPA